MQIQIVSDAGESGEGPRQIGNQVVPRVEHSQPPQRSDFLRQSAQLIVRHNNHTQFLELRDARREARQLIAEQVEDSQRSVSPDLGWNGGQLTITEIESAGLRGCHALWCSARAERYFVIFAIRTE